METDASAEKQPGCWKIVLIGLLIIVLVFLCRAEITSLWQIIVAFRSGQKPDLGIIFPWWEMLSAIFTSIAFYIFITAIISQVILPLRTISDKSKLFLSLLKPGATSENPILLIREGKPVYTPPVDQDYAPNLALIDPNSALVLEKAVLAHASASLLPASDPETAKPRWLRHKTSSPVRIVPPGLAFVKGGEKVLGTVSLRKQIRVNPRVNAYTREGIEIQTNVIAMFTLGQPTGIVYVVDARDWNAIEANSPLDLRVVEIDQRTKKIKVIGEPNELTPDEQNEVFNFSLDSTPLLSQPDQPSPLAEDTPLEEYPPYVFDAQRIFAAVRAQAINVTDSSIDDWSNLPTRVAVELFRNMLSQVNYDDLYSLDKPDQFNLIKDFKPRFARLMRLQGVVRCQYLFYKPGQIKKHGPIHKDMEINSDNFLFYPPVELSSWRILRNSGIKLIWAGFSDLSPVNPAVQQQRLENWRARWENEANLTKADNDLEVMRIRNRALAQAQRELIFQLMQIYETSSLSPEVLSLRIFQVLEGKASDPTTRQFVPREYLDFLRSLQAWLQPGETDPGSKSPANTS